MARQGIFIPRAQFKKLSRVLDKVFSILNDIEQVIINGDVKHAFDRLLRQERVEVKQLLERLTSTVKNVIIIRGNHDNYLPLVLRDYNIELKTHYLIKMYGNHVLITHGHKIVKDVTQDLIIIGHEHPSIAMVDDLGFIARTQAYLRIPLTINAEILVLPAIGAYQPGNKVSLYRDTFLSPYIRRYGIVEEAIPYILIEGHGAFEMPKLKHILGNILKIL